MVVSPINDTALQRALDEGKLDHAVHLLMLLLGDPLSGPQKRRFATLQRAVAKTEELLALQQHVELTPGSAARDEDAPLSYSQLQMFTLQTLAPDSTAYNIVRAVQVSSQTPYCREALTATCDVLLAKHDVLRTLFVTDQCGEPQQRVMDLSFFKTHSSPVFQELQLGQSSSLDQIIAAQTSKPFDLASEAPIRVYAIKTGAADASWVLVTVIHHIATDPESSAVFWEDLTAMYSAFQREPPCEREQLLQSKLDMVKADITNRVSYRDYAQWQRRRLQSGMLASSLQYWIQQLSHEEIPQLELPYDRPLPVKLERERRGRTVVFQSSPQLQQAFSSLCASHGSSMFIGLMAIFHMLLSRLANCDDIVIGAPTAGRSHDALSGLMGYFVNTLPFRLQSQHDGSFVSFLETVKRVVVDGFSHMEIPLQKMLEHVQFDRTNSQNSVFSVMFAWEGGSESNKQREWKDVELPHETAKFDLMLSMRYATNAQGNKVLEGTLEYPVDVFDAVTIERFTGYFLELASQVTQFPETKKLSEIQMIPTLERELMLNEWGVPPAVTQSSESLFLDEYVRNQVQRTPGNVALQFEGVAWTYDELWHHSSKLAAALQTGKVDSSEYPLAGVRVGLFVDRGLENIASIIGVLQAKAVFIPLDPEFPVDRIQYMIADSQAEVVITQRHLVAKLTSLLAQPNSVRILICEDAFKLEASVDTLDSRPPAGMDPVNTIAYILYTSGSTGKPKGVMVTHANILTTLEWSVREYAVKHDDIFLQSTSSTLDGSLTQLFTPLLAGASALVTKKNGLHDLAYLAGLLTSHRVTCCVFVPSYFAMLIDYMGEFPQYVKHVVLAGEAFPTALATKFYEKHARYCEISGKRVSTTCLVNEYGPTEASVTSTFFRYPCELALSDDTNGLDKQQSVPIGRGNDDHFLVVLDKNQRLVPTNVPGELYVGGRGVAKGYWGRPDLTQKTFFSHEQLSWTQQCPAIAGTNCAQPMRWYKTGDLVKWLPCGELLFLGRTDSQVKLRGMRIELQEVRNVLLQSSQVKDAEVLVVNQRLVGYVILAAMVSAQGKQISELREYAARRLPVHMVPHEIIIVDQWPRTPNGKLDLRALAQIKAVVATKKSESVGRGNQGGDEESDSEDCEASSVSTIVVDILKQAWREVLDVDDDATLCRASFFELGGNSLSAIRVISLVKPHGLALKLESFFRCKTLLEMAAGCSSTLSTDVSAKTTKNIVVPLNWKPWQPDTNAASSSRSVPLFLVHCADGTVWKMMELARRLPVPVFGLQATHGGLAVSVEELAKTYWREIKAVQRCGPYRIGGFSFGCRIAHAIAMLGHEEGAQFLPLALLDGVPFHYTNRQKSKSSSEDECPEEAEANDADGNVTEYVAKALGFKPSAQQPQDGEGKPDHVRDPERELFDQLVTNYESHCQLDHLYRPCASGRDGQKSILIPATLFKTEHWSLDEVAYRQMGVDMKVVGVEGEHLTMLRTPNVDSVARALLATI